MAQLDPAACRSRSGTELEGRSFSFPSLRLLRASARSYGRGQDGWAGLSRLSSDSPSSRGSAVRVHLLLQCPGLQFRKWSQVLRFWDPGRDCRHGGGHYITSHVGGAGRRSVDEPGAHDRPGPVGSRVGGVERGVPPRPVREPGGWREWRGLV